jgi:hypothetical protein
MNAITSEPSFRYQVQNRWRNPLPEPYRNDWQLIASFHDANSALSDAAENEREDHMGLCEYRVVDTETDEVVDGCPVDVQRVAYTEEHAASDRDQMRFGVQ